MAVDEQLLEEANKLKLTVPFKYAAVTHVHWSHIVWLVENNQQGGLLHIVSLMICYASMFHVRCKQFH
ncbi:MAG: hypothetical protein WC979_01025 [Candidatus Pacearchaeota archaeon]|jgi:hypothetical protein|nr:hypothetical protein [Clostridia bacterium]